MIKRIYKKLLSEKNRIVIREFIFKLTAPFYYGSNFYCNCCDKNFRKFLPKGNTLRLNAQCPNCLSLERTRVLDLYLENELKIYNLENCKILHFAPETALFKKLNKIINVEYIDADINTAYARYEIDITKIPYPENYFDFIICSHVLGHVPDEKLAIEEMYRVIKQNGIVLISSLLSKNKNTYENSEIKSATDKLNHYGESDLCRLHGKDFSTRIKSAGFIVEEIDYRLSFSDNIQKKYSLGDGAREVIFKCKKNS